MEFERLDELKRIIRKHALDNAVKFHGKANPGAVIGKIIGEMPEIKAYMHVLKFEATEIINQINSQDAEESRQQLEKEFPEMLEKKEREERDIFAFLKIDASKPVITGFPPGPEKYPHIGHAKACLMNYLIAQQYHGKFILRFEDTNPNLVREEFYNIMMEDYAWIGAKWDELLYASDHMERYYQFALQAIKEGHAYMCFCNEEAIKKSRSDATACACRDHSVEQNLKYWNEFSAYPEGKAILRLKIDLAHLNSTMRDPTIFRIIDKPHPRLGTTYKIWPNYDWQNAIMDSYSNMTIRVRSKEFEMRNDLQRYIQEILRIPVTRTYEFARFNLKGVEASGRIIREKVASGEYRGWDDPRLTTIRALKRRGFLPEAIKNFVIMTGMTKSESTLTWDDLIIQNKRILDKTAKRFFMMHDYEKIVIHHAPIQTITLDLHPDNDEYGKRILEVGDEFLLLKSDLAELQDNNLYRLMDCLNFRKVDGRFEFDSLEYAQYKSQGKKIMHWLPAYNNIDIEIMMDDATTITGVAEHTITQLHIGDIIQFERFGFCRLDEIHKEKGKTTYKLWFTHK